MFVVVDLNFKFMCFLEATGIKCSGGMRVFDKFKVQINNNKHYLVLPVNPLTSNTTLRSCFLVVDGKESGKIGGSKGRNPWNHQFSLHDFLMSVTCSLQGLVADVHFHGSP